MAPKADSTAKDNNSTKTFSFDDVAYLIAKLEANKVGLGAKDYQNMAQLNGDRSEHGYNHLFRGVKARGKDLLPMITGGAASPVGRKTKAGANGEKKGAKRGRKARSEEREDEYGEEVTKKKKVKTEGAEGEGEDQPN